MRDWATSSFYFYKIWFLDKISKGSQVDNVSKKGYTNLATFCKICET